MHHHLLVLLHLLLPASAPTTLDSCPDEPATEWRPPSAAAQRWLERFGPTGCEGFTTLSAKDAAKHLLESEPALVKKALRKAQRSTYDAPALLKSHGNTHVAHAHPAYHVLAQGNPEKTQELAKFVRDMHFAQPLNASFAFDHAAQIGAREKVHGLPFELREEMPMRVFSLGADGTGLGMHSHGATYLRLAHGHKLWLVAKPGTLLPPSMVEPVWAHGFELLERYERLAQLEDGGAAASLAALTVCLQAPGTGVYLPDGWLHATINLGDTVGLALQSEGFVTEESPAAGKQERRAMAERMLAEPASHTIEELILATDHWMKDGDDGDMELAREVSKTPYPSPARAPAPAPAPVNPSPASLAICRSCWRRGGALGLFERPTHPRGCCRSLALKTSRVRVQLARASAIAYPRDLRAFFKEAQAATTLGDSAVAMVAMEAAAARAVAIATEQPGAVPRQLAALWLLRVAFSLCGPMRSSAAGSVHLRMALEYWPDCLEDNALRETLEECQRCAEDEQCLRDEAQARQ